MPEIPSTTKDDSRLAALRPGDRVRVRHRHHRHEYEGEVDEIARRQRILWILHGSLLQRILIEASEYEILHHSPAFGRPAPGSTIP